MLNKQALVDAITHSGGKQNALDEVAPLWAKLDYLQQTGRFTQLLSQLAKSNDKSNFLALTLEVNFAYQFELQGLELTYEVKQITQEDSSIDFLHTTSDGDNVYFEIRLLQQRLSILDSIRAQLKKCNVYHIAMNGRDERNEIVRIQNTILSKVQDKKGRSIKFFPAAANSVNIVVVDASDSILGTIDIHDCKLVAYGDPSVEEVYRRGVFGLFQANKQEYPIYIQNQSAKYSHIRDILHGVLFLFKKPGTGILAYQLEQHLMWNPALVDTDKQCSILDNVARAIPTRSV